MAKYSEDFTVATWDKNGGSRSTTANAIAAPEWQHDRGHHHGGDRRAAVARLDYGFE